MASDLQTLRLGFKRAFTEYYLALVSPGIADPTEAFAAGYEYLSALQGRLGVKEFMYRLDDDTVHLAGQIEQDLRHKARRGGDSVMDDPTASDDLEDRLRECMESALARLVPDDVVEEDDEEAAGDEEDG